MWADFGLRPVIGTTLDIKVALAPLSDGELDLLLSCWTKWEAKSVTASALATWLCEVDSEYGPESEDSPHFCRGNIDFFPESDREGFF